MSEKRKQPEFVVTDRRKFTTDGERREPDAAPEAAPVVPAPPPEESKPAAPRSAAAPPASAPETPPPPTAAEQASSRDAYQASGRRLDPYMDLRGRRPEDFQMTFEKLVASLYMTALMQLGLMHEEGRRPVADLVGARQTIDTLGVLEEKTRGNLSPEEKNLLEHSLYELRMAFVEVTRHFTQAPPGGEAAS
ncbi:MAG TPA: DUF1844 domain-containing protein [Terriglobales bacterium]|nr:DUF1844 domain-containing protein [Terriglobales bacterium]